MNTFVIALLLFLASCSNYIGNLHRQIDREENRNVKKQTRDRRHDPYAQYRPQNRSRREGDRRPIKDPVTYSLGSGPSGQMRPPVKREYRPQRYGANDFKDAKSDGSLWANQGSSSSLFTYQNDKHTGDMVIINVLESLRNQISSELKRVFPDKPKKTASKDKDKKEEKKDEVNTQAAAPAGPQGDEHDIKVYDKISGVVMEEISKDYILLRGRKDVIFKKEKRSIEVQGLVSRKDIMENDYVNSDKLLDSRVFILRESDQ
jgi:flagellar basal body L-ring protein FlgH